MPVSPAARIVAGMSCTTSLTNLSASELAQAIARDQVSAVEAVEAHIARIEEVNPRLNAVVVPRFDDARKQAHAADRLPAAQRGPLHGLPVTVKECFDLAGAPSTAGLAARSNHRATADAPLVAHLRQAGAIVLGKTNLSQLLLYVEADNPVYGRTNNPWNADRSPGGSSGGEACIVAAGGSALGLGTDVGGSVRVPAHCCGIHSLKPTPGQLPVEGTVDIVGAVARDAIPDSGGLLARFVADIRLGLDALSPSPTRRLQLPGVRVGFYEDDGYFPASPAIRRAVREAAAVLNQQGCQVAEFTPPDVSEALAIFYGLFGADGGAHWRAQLDGGTPDPRIKDLLTLAGMPNALRPLAATMLRLQGQPRLARTVRVTGKANDIQAAQLVQRRDVYRQRFAAAMSAAGVDVLICPPCAVPAFRHGSTRELGPASVSYTCVYNLLAYPAGVVTTTKVRAEEASGHPGSREKMLAAARAVDQGSAGLPVGVQVAAGPGGEDIVLAVMEALEASSEQRSTARL
ncbi:MAG: amidase [Chloroflexota bacterium]|nr:amidase [Chloroflexota bacterium]